MTDIYSRLRPTRGQSSSLKANLSSQSTAGLSEPHTAKAESLTATPSLSLSITTITPMDLKNNADYEPNLDSSASPSQSPTLVADMPAQNFKTSRSPTEPPTVTDGATSKASTPPLAATSKASRKVEPAVQLIGDLPIAREEAVRTFNEIYDNNYQYKTLGRSREILESMTCDCTYEHGVDSEDDACGPYSDCINRLTQVECLEEDCRCRKYCQNQRFQRKQYSNIEIVLTEKKGYGLRAEEDLPKDAFIYEYVGDVVNPVSFKKRMRDYAEEGIRHFYFMMLQKDEFIDATKSGGIGRFANHSCNPNCYVAKWTIGSHVRMGIFAKRNIKKHEELTFNYNVDRYGHQAQECFCGEPMCVGYIGGKTQTDIATMDDLYLDALGITDEDDLMELKGTKKKKGKKIDDPDFMPTMKAIVEKEVPKVVQAIRQTTSRKVLSKLLTRLWITEDQAALRQIMRLRGYSLMTNVLEDYVADMEMTALALQCMKSWPLLNRNKVQDSGVLTPVQACALMEDEKVKTLAQSLLDHWETLPTYNRIPKRKYQAVMHDPRTKLIPPAPEAPGESYVLSMSNHQKKHRRESGPTPQEILEAAKLAEEEEAKAERMRIARREALRLMWEEEAKAERMRLARREAAKLAEQEEANAQRIRLAVESKKAADAVAASAKALIAQVAAVAAAEEAAAAAASLEAKRKAEEAAEKVERWKERASMKKTLTPADKERNKEKRLQKLVGAVVVKSMSKYSKQFDREEFKEHAKELTQIISDKEKKSSSYRDGKLDGLSEEKEAKIKKFAKEYIAKIIRKMEKSHKRPRPSNSVPISTANNTPSTSIATPNSNDNGDNHRHKSISAEEAMGINLHSGSEDGDDYDDGDEDMEGNSRYSGETMQPPRMPVLPRRYFEREDSMDVDDAHYSTDPRRRHSLDIHS